MSTEGITTAHLREQIEQRTKASFFFVNVGDDEMMEQVAGHFYSFKPGETVFIGPRYDFQRGRKNALLRDEPKVIAEGADPVTISAKLLEFAGHKGLALCYGGPEDEEIKAAARRGYIAWRLEVAQNVQRKWLDTCAMATRDPGSMPPIQPARVKKEIAWLRKWQGGLVDRKAFVVRIDGSEFDTYQEAVDYVVSAYPSDVAKAGGPDTLVIDTKKALSTANQAADANEVRPLPQAEVVPPSPQQPTEVKPDDGDVSFVLRMAKTLGVKLSEGEYETLVQRDKPEMEKILERLVKVRNAKNAGKPKAEVSE